MLFLWKKSSNLATKKISRVASTTATDQPGTESKTCLVTFPRLPFHGKTQIDANWCHRSLGNGLKDNIQVYNIPKFDGFHDRKQPSVIQENITEVEAFSRVSELTGMERVAANCPLEMSRRGRCSPPAPLRHLARASRRIPARQGSPIRC